MSPIYKYFNTTFTYVVVNTLLVLLLSSDFLYRYLQIIGFSFGASFIVWSKLLLSIILLAINRKSHNSFVTNRKFVSIFIVYSLFCFYYIYVDRRIPLEDMLGIPNTDYILFLQFAILVLPLFSIGTIVDNFDSLIFSKIIVVLTSILFVLYFNEVDFWIYMAYSDKEVTGEELEELSIIHPFHIAHYAGQALLMLLFLKSFYAKKIKFKAAALIMFLINISALIIASKRGPILFFAITTITIYFIKNPLSKKLLITFIILGLVLFFFGDYIIEQLYNYLPSITNRFANTVDDGGSRRLGDKDSGYYVAMKQILENPFWGSHMRITAHNWLYGYYPHNFFLETLMCTGLFVSVVFYKYLYSVLLYSKKIITNNSIYIPIVYYFYFTFLMLMTSESICFNISFWIPLSILSFLQINKITK